MAVPLRGEGVKALPLREKYLSFRFFILFCSHLKIILFNFRQLIEVWTYNFKDCRLFITKKKPTAINLGGGGG